MMTAYFAIAMMCAGAHVNRKKDGR